MRSSIGLPKGLAPTGDSSIAISDGKVWSFKFNRSSGGTGLGSPPQGRVPSGDGVVLFGRPADEAEVLSFIFDDKIAISPRTCDVPWNTTNLWNGINRWGKTRYSDEIDNDYVFNDMLDGWLKLTFLETIKMRKKAWFKAWKTIVLNNARSTSLPSIFLPKSKTAKALLMNGDESLIDPQRRQTKDINILNPIDFPASAFSSAELEMIHSVMPFYVADLNQLFSKYTYRNMVTGRLSIAAKESGLPDMPKGGMDKNFVTGWFSTFSGLIEGVGAKIKEVGLELPFEDDKMETSGFKVWFYKAEDIPEQIMIPKKMVTEEGEAELTPYNIKEKIRQFREKAEKTHQALAALAGQNGQTMPAPPPVFPPEMKPTFFDTIYNSTKMGWEMLIGSQAAKNLASYQDKYEEAGSAQGWWWDLGSKILEGWAKAAGPDIPDPEGYQYVKNYFPDVLPSVDSARKRVSKWMMSMFGISEEEFVWYLQFLVGSIIAYFTLVITNYAGLTGPLFTVVSDLFKAFLFIISRILFNVADAFWTLISSLFFGGTKRKKD